MKWRSFFYSAEFTESQRERCTETHVGINPYKGITLSKSPGRVLSFSEEWGAGCPIFRVTSVTKTLQNVNHSGKPGVFRSQGSSAIFTGIMVSGDRCFEVTWEPYEYWGETSQLLLLQKRPREVTQFHVTVSLSLSEVTQATSLNHLPAPAFAAHSIVPMWR